MKKTTFSLGLATMLFVPSLFAHNIQLNMHLPVVNVATDGELMLQGEQVNYQAWNSANLAGKVRIVHHFAGRSSVKEKNEPLMAAIKAAQLSAEKYQTTTIINADDTVFGTGGFVKSSAEKGKKSNARSQVVLDQQSAVKNAWNLKEKESLIVVLDKNGKVKFVNEGALSAQQVQDVISLVTELTK
ncbi:YtfJ family protein [Pasteurella oralis]|uniref:YtfJ family protein n=1 Tax=Pasteurella oralis TaxID=1071947 RepID=A0ABW4NTB4_9PAST